MPKVLITGGKGLIGSRLSTLLAENGYDVAHMSRTVTGKEEFPTYSWDIENGTMDKKALKNIDSIIHLAGASIADEKWTEERKKEILNSRIESANLLKRTCEQEKIKLNSFISASAIGWYPLETSETVYDESAPAASGFLADVCEQWEQAADNMAPHAKNISKVRIGLVLSRYGGALKQIERPIMFYVGAGLGTGRQYMPWIHRFDIANIFYHILKNNLGGAYNAVGPDYITNQDFMQTVADIVDRPIILPNIPEFVVKTLFGNNADLVLNGPKISSKKILDSGFAYEFPTLTSALFNIYWSNKPKPGE